MWRNNCTLLVHDRIYSLLDNDAKYHWVDGTVPDDAGKASHCVKYNSDNRGQKWLRNSPKKTCFVEHVSFSISNFHISTPSPLFNVAAKWQCPRSVFQHWKGGERRFGYRQKRLFFEITEGSRQKAFVSLKWVNTFVHDCSFPQGLS